MRLLTRYCCLLTAECILGGYVAACSKQPVSGQTAAGGDSAVVHGVSPAYFDTTCAVCKDLYQRANGTWLKTTPVPPEYGSWGTFNVLYERSLATLRSLLDSLQTTQMAEGSPEWKVTRFWMSCMDSTRAETAGATPMAPELEHINAIASVSELRSEVARLQRMGVGPLFSFFAGQDSKDADAVIAIATQGGLGLPERDFYFRSDSASRRIQREYAAHVARTFALAGASQDVADAQAKQVMAFETQLAKASKTITALRDPKANYHKMAMAQMASLTPRWSWPAYFKELGAPNVAAVDVKQPAFFRAVNAMLQLLPLDSWKTYLRWQYISSAAPYLSTPFVTEDFRYNALLSGATQLRPRWKRCVNAADGKLGEALGQVYVARVFTPETKAKALTLVQNLEAVLRQDLTTLSWMSEGTRQQALIKLDAFVNKIGYPDKWRDYSALRVADSSAWPNIVAANEFEFARQLSKIGKPVDRTEWDMTPPTVNAGYYPHLNQIAFPAGILQSPFFDPEADDASNYGAIGTVIGHEITHGFDDGGRQYDAHGNLRDWWTPQDAAAYKRRAERVASQFDRYVAVDTLRVHGHQTLGENIADLGGTRIAYAALERALAGKPRTTIGGFTPEQRFFLSYAQTWKEVNTPEALRTQVQTDVHSPARWRINGPISNMPEFAQAFRCQATDPMVRPDSLRAQIW